MPRVTVYDRLADLDGLRPTWDRLHAATPGTPFERSLDYFAAIARTDPAVVGVRVYAVEHADEPIGLVPLLRTRDRGGVVTLGYATGGGLVGGTVGRDQAACLTTAMKHVTSRRRDWDVLELEEPTAAEAGTPLRRAEAAMRLAKLKVRTVATPAVASLSTAVRWVDVVGAADFDTRFRVFRAAYEGGGAETAADARLRFVDQTEQRAVGEAADSALTAISRTSGASPPVLRGLLEAAGGTGRTIEAAVLTRDDDVIAAHVGFAEGERVRSLAGYVSTTATEVERLHFVKRLVETARDRGLASITWRTERPHPCDGWAERIVRPVTRRNYAATRPRAQFRRLRDAAAGQFRSADRATPTLSVAG